MAQKQKISQEDLEELKNAFEQYDLDKDGSITMEEFKQCMNEIGVQISEEDVKKYIKEMDTNNNGKIEWSEFLEAKTKQIEQGENPFY